MVRPTFGGQGTFLLKALFGDFNAICPCYSSQSTIGVVTLFHDKLKTYKKRHDYTRSFILLTIYFCISYYLRTINNWVFHIFN